MPGVQGIVITITTMAIITMAITDKEMVSGNKLLHERRQQVYPAVFVFAPGQGLFTEI